ncbi:trypsinogen-like protein 3 [Notolabrus celidotus]|uniref:trypsinogen-like protein 3 n=1 Tax=Notolabrus celidotus TaxID=1203425 RepID=UPI00148FEF06|nr:trypsinogen-like protein 3 [Notolabrus celidotus]
MNFLLLVVALGLAGASPLPDSKVCQPHSKPWQVYIHGGHPSCSGALINKWWIVTSFNCPTIPYSSLASLGEHDVTVEEGTEQHIQVAEVIRHSPYRSPAHSLAMVRLAEPARLNHNVKTIPLPTRCTQPGETCYVSGWGSTVPNQYEPDQHLKCITVPVVDDQTCMNTLPEYIYWSHGMVCAGQNNSDNCLNDDGSVMVCDGQLQGVQWMGLGCSNPSVYTKLCLYNNWIREVMDNYAPPLTTQMPPSMTT